MIINPRKKVEAGAGARAPGGVPPIAPVRTPSGGVGGTGPPGRTGSGDGGAGAPRLERKGTAVASGKEFMKQLQEAVSAHPAPRGAAGRARRLPSPARLRSRLLAKTRLEAEPEYCVISARGVFPLVTFVTGVAGLPKVTNIDNMTKKDVPVTFKRVHGWRALRRGFATMMDHKWLPAECDSPHPPPPNGSKRSE